MKKLNKLIIPIIVFLITYVIYIFKLDQTFFYHPDFAWDLHEILKIAQGDIAFIGPKLTFGGLYTGPYYFYLYVPIFFLTRYSIASVFYFNAFLFSLALAYFCKKAIEAYGKNKGLFSSLALGLTPLFIIGGRSPSNAYAFIPFFLFLLTTLFFNKKFSRSLIIFIGFIFGVILNFHYVNLLFLPAILLFLAMKIKLRKELLMSIFLFFTGIAISFVPLVAFEIKNNFIMITNTFIQKSYLGWINNQNIPLGMIADKNPFKNILFLAKYIKNYTLLNPITMISVIGLLMVILKSEKKQWKLFFSILITFLLFSIVIRFQFIPHYIFGLSFFIYFILLITVLNQKNNYLFALIILFIVLEVIYFPKYLYQPTWRSSTKFEKAVNYVIDNNLLKKDDSFNVVQITKENLMATIGFEYRFFLRKNNYIANSEFAYKQSKTLIIFSELENQDVSQFKSWEVEEFGFNYLTQAKKYRIEDLTIYKVTKP